MGAIPAARLYHTKYRELPLPPTSPGTKYCIIFEKGFFSFGAAQVEKVDSLGPAKAEKWGGGVEGGGDFRAAQTRTVLIWEYPLSPSPALGLR